MRNTIEVACEIGRRRPKDHHGQPFGIRTLRPNHCLTQPRHDDRTAADYGPCVAYQR